MHAEDEASDEHDYQVDYNSTWASPSEFRTTIAIKVQALVATNTSSSLSDSTGSSHTKKQKKSWYASRDLKKASSSTTKKNGALVLDQEACDDVIYVTGMNLN